MSRFLKQSHTIWHCTYHLVWTPKYRYRILKGKIKAELEPYLHSLCSQNQCMIEELNIQEDHVHLILKVPPKHSVSKVMGILKGKSGIRIFNKNKGLKVKTYWGNHFWAKGYCVDTVGLNEEMIRQYVKFQEEKEKREEDN